LAPLVPPTGEPAAPPPRTEPAPPTPTTEPPDPNANGAGDIELPAPKPRQQAEANAPPQNLEAEESVLGAMMLSPAAIGAVRDIVGPGDFYRESHALIYTAALALADRGEGVDWITTTDELERTGKLEQAGGKARVAELAVSVPATANAAHYARIVHKLAVARALIAVGGDVARLGWESLEQPDELLRQVEAVIDRARLLVRERPEDEYAASDRAQGGGTFAFDEPADVPALWGTGQAIAWAAGEGLMLVGPDGVGKTALQQQLLLARLGLRAAVLGIPVAPADRPLLYIAADRPRQAARSFRRMVVDTERAILEERLIVWKGPLPFDPVLEPGALLRFAKSFGAGELYIDALKDIALDLSKDEAGTRINRAFQELIAEGIDLCVSHHQRKEQQASAKAGKPTRLADVYGSRWLSAGMGSVLLLWGEPGDLVVELSHLKQPAEDVGPFQVIHNHTAGTSSVFHAVDLETLADEYGGVTAQRAAMSLYGAQKPTANQVEKARRRLEALVVKGTVYRADSTGGASYLTRRP
jgi:replicative DNA helicase